MKLTNGEVFQAREPLGKLMREKFPVKVSYELVKVAHALDGQLKTINVVRDQLIKQYGTPMKDNQTQFSVDVIIEKLDKNGEPMIGPDGQPIMESNPNFPTFAAELNTLFEEEIEIDFKPMKLPDKVASTCDKCHHNMDRELEVEASVLLALEKFLSFN